MTNIQSLIAQMTLEEKAALCTGDSAWTTTPVKRLDIPELLVSDGPHGIRRVPDVQSMSIHSMPATRPSPTAPMPSAALSASSRPPITSAMPSLKPRLASMAMPIAVT